MAIFNFFRTPKPQRFRYIPRHYDPEREEMKRRLEEVQQDYTDDSPEAIRERMRAGFKRKQVTDPSYRRKHLRRSNRILLLTMIVLVIAAVIIIGRVMDSVTQWLD